MQQQGRVENDFLDPAKNSSVFSKLKRLFSTDSIIRNIGADKLQVFDPNSTATTGRYATNSLTDRFNRLSISRNTHVYNPNLNYETLRIQLYSDYEGMDTDAIISSALDIVGDEATALNDDKEILMVKSPDVNVQAELQNLFDNVLNLKFALRGWVREMAKFGDVYLKLEIHEKYGVYGVIPYKVYQMTRHEGEDREEPYKVNFLLEPDGVTLSRSLNYTGVRSSTAVTLENYEVAHFRYIGDLGYYPYGRSYLEPARILYKQVRMMEDAMLIHRITRAPERRIFYVNTGNLQGPEIDNLIQRMSNNMKKNPYIDPATKQFNWKFDIHNLLEDYYIPVRGGDATTKIDTLKGLEYDGIADIEYLQQKLFAALKIPKAYFGYEGELQGKATLASEDIRFAKTIQHIQKIVESELKKIAITHLYCRGFRGESLFNFDLKLSNSSTVHEQERIMLLKEKIELAAELTDSGLFSSDYVYETLFGMAERDYARERNLVVEDAKRLFRREQIQAEGNDPVKSGKSYGTPHDLATAYNDKKDRGAELHKVPAGFEEQPIMGRPKEKASFINTQQDPLGRDRHGVHGMKGGYESEQALLESMGLGGLIKRFGTTNNPVL